MPGARAATGTGPAGTQQGTASDRADIALFPLGTVLFPAGPLPLRIFETRYIDLVRRCLRENSGFGVVLITDGAEAGSAAPQTADVGCYATIVDFSQQPDGLLGIQVMGGRRFRILDRRQAPDGLNLASVAWLPDDAPVALPEEFAELVPVLDNVLDQVRKQLDKIVSIVRVDDISSENYVERDLMLITELLGETLSGYDTTEPATQYQNLRHYDFPSCPDFVPIRASVHDPYQLFF